MSRIIKFEVTGVWGSERKSITFNNDMNFLVGINGSGKTTILKIIYAISTADIVAMHKLHFSSAYIVLNNNCNIAVSKDRGNIEFVIIDQTGSLSFDFDIEDNEYIVNKKIETIKERIASNLNVRFLSINRKDSVEAYDFSPFSEKEGQSPVDLKLDEISAGIVSEFSKMSQRFNNIAARFQKNIFFKMLDIPSESEISIYKDEIDINSEKAAISEIMSFFINKSSKNDSMSKV